eukprot:20014-Heterococcus_DN1.PRE.2
MSMENVTSNNMTIDPWSNLYPLIGKLRCGFAYTAPRSYSAAVVDVKCNVRSFILPSDKPQMCTWSIISSST